MRVKALLTLLLAGAAAAFAQDRVTLAEWTFDNAYNTATGEGNVTVYTPTANAAADETGWFNNITPHFLPDTYAGEQTDSYLTAYVRNRYFQLASGYNNRVLRIENQQDNANEGTDWTDASTHIAYYELVFPTKGYKNVQVTFAISGGNNAANEMEMVVSTDGGNTWFDAGKYVTAGGWWLYNDYTLDLSANNKADVRMRILPPAGVQTNWNMDYARVTAEEAGQATVTGEVNAYWGFNSGADSAIPAVVSVDNVVSNSSWKIGSNLSFSGTLTLDGNTFTKLKAATKISADNPTATNAAIFTIIPKKGVSFTPTKLEFLGNKIGTDGGRFTVDVVADGVSTRLVEKLDPQRNNKTPAYSTCSYDITGLAAASQSIEVIFYFTDHNAGKEIGLCNVRLYGTYTGVAEEVPVYSFKASTSEPAAGNISVVPVGSEFDEGTEIIVNASENFGYHFDCWKDINGNVVSTENPYTFTLTADTELVAYYTHKNVYSLIVNLEGGANPNLMTFAPEGNVVDGIHYYEEGTEVVLTPLNNRILTFTNWENNSTTAAREIRVTDNTEVTANFSCEDYIVAWDLYEDTPSSERPADYRADSANAGVLSLRTAAGNTIGWLAGGHNKGMQRGHYCARVWRPYREGYYFEISFSTIGYSNIVLSAYLGNDFPSYVKYDVEYSIDGENFTKFAEYSLPNRGWTAGENALPADANNQNKVWIRFMADKTSGMTGSGAESATEETTDGFSVADIYVLADSEAASDETAPVLVSSIPAAGDTDVPSNGQVILNFDERVMLAEGAAATLAGETLTGIATGKTVAFKYAGLEYGKSYKFTLPEGAVTDRNGNAFAGVSLQFTVMERQQPEARLYDVVVAKDGSGDYTSLQEAIDNAPAGRGKPYLIFVKKGRYNEHIDIPATKPFMHIIGQDRDNTVIYDNRLSGGENAVHVSIGATVVVNANDCFFENITFENSHGHEKQDGPQALALNTIGDRTIFNNVGMLSYQDTWITPSTSNYRVYVTNSFIEGAVDFIYNSGNIFIDNTTLYITRKSGGFIVAPSHEVDVEWGYVFTNCTITAPGVPSQTEVWLGRPWHNYPKTVFINTCAEVTIPATGWYPNMGGLPVLWAEYNTYDANGNPVDLSNRRDTYWKEVDGQKVYGTAKNYLTDEEAAQYTVKNVLSGNDAWQPALKVEACAAPEVKFTEDYDHIVWENIPYAICYVVSIDGEVVDFTTNRYYPITYNAASTYHVQAVNEFGGLSRIGVSSGTTSVEAVEAAQEDATPVYFDMQGRRVDNPGAGLYIRLTGNRAEKVMLK